MLAESACRLMWAPLKRVKVKSFVWRSKQTIQFVNGKDLRVKETTNLFANCTLADSSTDLDMGEVFGCYELSAVPEGMHIHGGDGKSDLVTAIIKSMPDVEPVITVPNSVSGKQILVIRTANCPRTSKFARSLQI